MGIRPELFVRCLPAGFKTGLAAIAIAAVAMSGTVQAQTMIDPGESIGGVPTYAGTGLWGLYYDNSAGSSSANGSPPDATFMTTNVCYPDCLGNSFSDGNGGLIQFTNGNAFGLANRTPLRAGWDQSELDITGYIAITHPGTYTFTIGSDDNTSFTLGGSLLQVMGGGPTSTTDTFTAAGLYPISLQFFEFGGASRLSLTGTDPNGSCILGCYDGNILENDLFYSDEQLQGAPAPVIGGGWPAMLAGLLAAGILVHRRRTSACIA